MTKGEKKIHSLPFLPSIYTYTHTRTISRSCDKAVPLVFPSCNSSTETPMGNTARRRRQAGRRRAVQTSTKAGVQSNPILGPAPDHMCHPKDFLACLLYSAVQDFVACRSNLFVSKVGLRWLFFFSAVRFAWHWAGAWLWGIPACAPLLHRWADVGASRGGLQQGRMIF
jgi:hypothetical protein